MAHYKFHNDCQSSVLTYEQVKRLDFVMDQTVPIHGRGNYPTLYVKLKQLIRLVKNKLQKHSIEIRDVRLNGGAASYVLAPENSHYNDLDLIFGTDLSDEGQFDVIREVVLECLKEFFPNYNQSSPNRFLHEEEDQTIQDYHQNEVNVVDLSGSRHFNEDGDELIGSFGATSTSHAAQSNVVAQSSIRDHDDFNEMNDQEIIDSSVEENTSEEKKDKTRSTENSSINHDSESLQKNQKILKKPKKIEGTHISLDEGDQRKEDNEQQGRGDLIINDSTSKSSISRGTSNTNIIQQHHNACYQMPLSNCAIKEAYVHKMVKVNDDDRWSLISLGVHQSEANCGKMNCFSNQCTCDLKQQFAVTTLANDDIKSSQTKVINNKFVARETSINNDNSVAQSELVASTIVSNNQQHPYNHSICIKHHYKMQEKQCPNSIELKFVDRMRRKFEFSVDSFQIILDSLIKFYDYAPQAGLITTAPSEIAQNFVNLRSISSKSARSYMDNKRCPACCRNNDNSFSLPKTIGKMGGNDLHGCSRNHHNHNHNHHHQHQCHQRQHSQSHKLAGNRSCTTTLMNTSRSYYQLPIETASSQSIPSEASSSGCSSSSSVVSSSSSSLSCDDDDHDYLDYYGDSSSSLSTMNTTTLVSSNDPSVLQTDGASNMSEMADNNIHDSVDQSDDSASRSSTNSQLRLVGGHDLKKLNQQHNGLGRSEKSSSCSSASSSSSTLSTIPAVSAPSPLMMTLSKESSACDCFECLGQHPQQQLLNNIYDFETATSCAVISENFYPTVIGRSEYGNFKEALYHLERKLIATRSPEEIRGGGLLKYCNLLVKNYKPTNIYQIRTLERYMCSRFFIDFSDLNQQQAKLESYLANHFSDDPILKFDYLTILHNVVQRSTVCLMNHELRLTLNMIRDLAYKLNEHQQRNSRQAVQQQPSIPSKENQSQHQHNNQQQMSPQRYQSMQAQSQQHQQQLPYQQKPISLQSGAYRVKLVNFTLVKPVGP